MELLKTRRKRRTGWTVREPAFWGQENCSDLVRSNASIRTVWLEHDLWNIIAQWPKVADLFNKHLTIPDSSAHVPKPNVQALVDITGFFVQPRMPLLIWLPPWPLPLLLQGIHRLSGDRGKISDTTHEIVVAKLLQTFLQIQIHILPKTSFIRLPGGFSRASECSCPMAWWPSQCRCGRLSNFFTSPFARHFHGITCYQALEFH